MQLFSSIRSYEEKRPVLLDFHLFKDRRARVININRRRFFDLRHKGVVLGEEENRRYLFFFLALRARSLTSSPIFLKIAKRKIKQRLFTGYTRLGSSQY